MVGVRLPVDMLFKDDKILNKKKQHTSYEVKAIRIPRYSQNLKYFNVFPPGHEINSDRSRKILSTYTQISVRRHKTIIIIISSTLLRIFRLIKIDIEIFNYCIRLYSNNAYGSIMIL